ncbi:hypothetical protein [Xanthobacter autotrophicus]|uniref:phage head spike fiber domain-containing protein n=1 Tax=Xanthobacter autotrophicus TaxID=280 RepID=UPI00372B4188
MSTPEWPSALSFAPLVGDWNVDPYRSHIETEMEGGNVRIRRRPARLPLVQWGHELDPDQFAAFDDFVADTLFDGTARFLMPVTLGGAAFQVRLVQIQTGSLKLSAPSPNQTRVSFAVYVFPPSLFTLTAPAGLTLSYPSPSQVTAGWTAEAGATYRMVATRLSDNVVVAQADVTASGATASATFAFGDGGLKVSVVRLIGGFAGPASEVTVDTTAPAPASAAWVSSSSNDIRASFASVPGASYRVVNLSVLDASTLSTTDVVAAGASTTWDFTAAQQVAAYGQVARFIDVQINRLYGAVPSRTATLLYDMLTPQALDGVVPSLALDIPRDRLFFGTGGGGVALSSVLTRTGGSKVVVGSTGALETVATNTLAYDYSSGRKKLLLEGNATNLMLRSQEFGTGPWVSSMTVTSNVIAAPDGTMTADMLTLPGTATPGHYQTATVTASTAYVFSVWVRLGTLAAADFKLAFRDDTAGVFIAADIVPTVLPTADGWTRISYALTTPAGCVALRCYPYRHSGSPTGTFYLWGAQLELGSRPTSYIATTTATVTRGVDLCQLSAGAAALFAVAAATVAMRASQGSTVGSGGANLYLIGTRYGAGSNGAICRGSTANVQMMDGAGGNYVTIGTGLPGNVGIAIGWDAAGRRGSAGGVAPATSAVPMTTPTAVYLGAGYSLIGGQWIELDELVVWPVKGSSAGVQAQARVWQ